MTSFEYKAVYNALNHDIIYYKTEVVLVNIAIGYSDFTNIKLNCRYQ